MLLPIAILAAAVTTGPVNNAQKLDPTAELRSLVEVEHAFAKAVAARGVRDGFLAYLADDGVLFRPGPVNGKESWAARPASKALLGWEPVFADVSRTGDLGYTTGPWELRPEGRTDRPTAFGHYVTLWRKQPDGAWKAALDVGITHARPKAKPRPYKPGAAGGATVLRPAADPDSERVVLLQADRDFSAAVAAKGVAPAYEAFAARELRLYREGSSPLVGLPAARPVLQAQAGRLSWEPIGGTVARACDLGYTYGSYRSPGGLAGVAAGERGYYARIWKRRANGAWAVVLDLLSPAPEPEAKP
jgi:ketosteroid isomerase-like protein